MTPAEMSSAATFEAWATGAAAITTAVAIFLGGIWAVWRFLLPGLIGAGWESGPEHCSARLMEDGRFRYTVAIELKNVSYTTSVVEELASSFFNDWPSSEERDARLDAKVGKMEEVKAPTGVARRIGASVMAAPPMLEGVFVAWRIKYRKPRLGIGWLGWDKHEKSEETFVPVDAESLTLYSKWRAPFKPEKGKEETS